MTDIGLEVKLLRERLAMSAKDLAERIGLSPSQMSRLEKGQRRVDTKILARIADALGVDPSHFFGEASPPVDGVVPPSRPSSVGKLVRAERRKRHISSEDLAARAGVPRFRIVDVEEGKRRLDADLAERIRRALKLPPSFFLDVQTEEIAALEAQVEQLHLALAEAHRGGALGRDGSRPGIPVLSTLAGGYPAHFDVQGVPAGEPDDFVFVPGVQAPGAFGVLVVGDSMSSATPPSFGEGDLIVCAEGQLRSRDFALVRRRAEDDEGESVLFRQVFFDSGNRIRLQPLNLSYPPGVHQRAEILGMWRVVAHVERF